MTTFAAVLEQLARGENPYPGLRPFDTPEAHLFYGRDEQIVELAERLENNRFVAVVGLSGSGKSSLVRAGLIPALQQRSFAGARERWRVAITRPGGTPIANLAACLRDCGIEPHDLRRSSQALAHVTQQLRERESLLLIVDQFEELFRYKEAEWRSEEQRRRREQAASEAADFVDLLLAATRREPPVFVVLTMRSDYLGDCAEFTGLPEALNESQYLVPRLSRAQLRLAIEGPLGGAIMEPALVQRILNDAGEEPDELPALQHALMRTWSHWRRSVSRGRAIGLEDYHAIGGFAGALDHHAEELFGHAIVRENPRAVEYIFQRLTARGQRQRERRNPATLADLWAVCGAESEASREHVKEILDVFRSGDATFLVPRDVKLEPDTYIDITHESLIHRWKQLRDEWLPKEQASAREFVSLVDWARDWNDRKREVLQGLDLKTGLEWDRDRNPNPAWALHYADSGALQDVIALLDASKRAERARAAAARRTLMLVTGVALVLLALVVALVYYSIAARRAQASARHARDVASAQRLATEAKLMRETQPGKSDLGLLLAIESLKLAQTPEGSEELWRATRLLATPTVRLHHESPVSSAVFGPKPYIVTLPVGNEAVLWNENTGKQEGTYPHSHRVNAFALSPDRGRISTVSADGEVKLWETRTRKLLWTQKHSDAVNHVTFSGNGRFLATASDDGTARVWQVENGAWVASVRHEGAVEMVALNDSGDLLATAGNDGPARLWRVGGGRLGEMPHTGPVTGLQFFRPGGSPRGGPVAVLPSVARGLSSFPEILFSSGYDRTIQCWTPEPFGRVASIRAAASSFEIGPHPDLDYLFRFDRPDEAGHGKGIKAAVLPFSDVKPTFLRFANSGDVMTESGNTAQFWDLRAGQADRSELGRIVTPARIGSIAVRMNDDFDQPSDALTASADGDVRIWDLARRSPMQGPTRAGWLLSTDTMWLASVDELGVAIYDAPFTTPRTRFNWPNGAQPYAAVIERGRWPGAPVEFSDSRISAQLSAGGRIVAGRDGRGNISIWDIETQMLVRQIAGRPRPEFAESFFAVTSNRLLVAEDRGLDSTDVRTGATAGHIDSESPFIRMLLSPDGRTIAAQTRLGQLYVVPASGWKAASPVKSMEPMSQMQFSPDGSQLAFCGPSDDVLLVDIASLASKSIKLPSPCQSVAFDPAGQVLIAGKSEGAEIWDLRSMQRRSVFSNQFPATSVAFGSGGTVIATSGNGVLHLWSYPDLEELQRIPDVVPQPLRFAAKDRFIAAGNRFFYWRPEDVIPAACQKAARNLTPAERATYLTAASSKSETCPSGAK